MIQTQTGSRTAVIGDLAATYFGVYINKLGVFNSFPSTREQLPFRVKAISIWVARPGGLNPDGVKLIMSLSTTDEGRNIDLLQAPQRCHYHLTWHGDLLIPYSLILEACTQGMAAADIFNYTVFSENVEP